MRFQGFDYLRVFNVAARNLSFSGAADELNLTKGAVSYQIRRLEEELGFAVFHRGKRGVTLTDAGRRLWQTSQEAHQAVEDRIEDIRGHSGRRITVAMATYFASRWLSPRLMTFISGHPDIALLLHPTVGIVDFQSGDIDMAVRWGKGDWPEMEVEPLISCPAWLVASADTAETIVRDGVETVLRRMTLLGDDQYSDAWRDWHDACDIAYRPAYESLSIPDPNVRLEAVINGQGVAFYDRLAEPELSDGRLVRVSDVELTDYGFFLTYPKGALKQPARRAFRDWIVAEAAEF